MWEKKRGLTNLLVWKTLVVLRGIGKTNSVFYLLLLFADNQKTKLL